MDKGYYVAFLVGKGKDRNVAIHNKNGQGLLPLQNAMAKSCLSVAIHNKNGQGLLPGLTVAKSKSIVSQSTIKMDKGYYREIQSLCSDNSKVAIHNKNGQGLLQK